MAIAPPSAECEPVGIQEAGSVTHYRMNRTTGFRNDN